MLDAAGSQDGSKPEPEPETMRETMNRKYYAIEWPCGYGATEANTGRDFVRVHRYDSKEGRDAAVEEYEAPNHCPTARMEAAPSSNRNVRRAIRENVWTDDLD